MPETIRTRADWVQVLEATTANEPDDRRWATDVLDTATSIFPRASELGMIIVPSDQRFVASSTMVMSGTHDASSYMAQLDKAPAEIFYAFMRPPVPVSTQSEIRRALSDDASEFMRNAVPA